MFGTYSPPSRTVFKLDPPDGDANPDTRFIGEKAPFSLLLMLTELPLTTPGPHHPALPDPPNPPEAVCLGMDCGKPENAEELPPLEFSPLCCDPLCCPPRPKLLRIKSRLLFPTFKAF